jgi:proteasome accessory factor B
MLLLSPEGMRVPALAHRLGVDRRTVYRDLDFLSTQGVPIWQEGGCYGLIRTRYLTTIRLSYQESMALVLAGLLLARTLDERNPHAVSALRRLAVSLPEFPAAHLERAAARLEASPRNSSQIAVLEALLSGWGNACKVKIAYRSPNSGALRGRVIAPYAIEPTASGIYVIGHDDWSDEIRTFKLERLENARVLEDPYSIPPEFDPDEYLATSWGIMAGRETCEVLLRFSPAARALVLERNWHPTQEAVILPDGSCELRVHVSQPVEMQPWIRSWGSQVEVVAPEWLRDQIAAELRMAADQYPVLVMALLDHEIEFT